MCGVLDESFAILENPRDFEDYSEVDNVEEDGEDWLVVCGQCSAKIRRMRLCTSATNAIADELVATLKKVRKAPQLLPKGHGNQ